jgi:hypothetical protein
MTAPRPNDLISIAELALTLNIRRQSIYWHSDHGRLRLYSKPGSREKFASRAEVNALREAGALVSREERAARLRELRALRTSVPSAHKLDATWAADSERTEQLEAQVEQLIAAGDSIPDALVQAVVLNRQSVDVRGARIRAAQAPALSAAISGYIKMRSEVERLRAQVEALRAQPSADVVVPTPVVDAPAPAPRAGNGRAKRAPSRRPAKKTGKKSKAATDGDAPSLEAYDAALARLERSDLGRPVAEAIDLWRAGIPFLDFKHEHLYVDQQNDLDLVLRYQRTHGGGAS